MTFQRVAIFSFEQFSYFCHNFLYRCPNAVIQVAMERYSETYNFHEEIPRIRDQRLHLPPAPDGAGLFRPEK